MHELTKHRSDACGDRKTGDKQVEGKFVSFSIFSKIKSRQAKKVVRCLENLHEVFIPNDNYA